MPKLEHRYIPTRLVKYADMGDYKFKYIEAPRCLAHNMAGVPVSDYEFGVIVTDRFVLESQLEKAGLRRWVKHDPEVEAFNKPVVTPDGVVWESK